MYVCICMGLGCVCVHVCSCGFIRYVCMCMCLEARGKPWVFQIPCPLLFVTRSLTGLELTDWAKLSGQ